MRGAIGAAVLALGVGGLSWWGGNHQAERMEAEIAAAASDVAAGAVHPVETRVLGRDVEISGIADSGAERDALLAALNDVPGRRVVRDDLEVLPAQTPYLTQIAKPEGGTLTASGAIPRDALRSTLAETGVGGLDALELASGAPDTWAGMFRTGAAALDSLNHGDARLQDMTLTITGAAQDPTALAAMQSTLAAVPDGVTVDVSAVTLLDDGTPPAVTLAYDAALGLEVSGKLPSDVAVADIGAALGVARVTGDPAQALDAAGGDLLDRLAVLRSWIGITEQGTLAWQNGTFSGDLALGPGADLGLVAEALEGTGVDARAAQISAEPGATRVNAATGQEEVFQSGFWLPALEFDANLETCGANANDALARARVRFVSGSATLDPAALAAVNGLAAVVARCVDQADLRAEIGGHTDSSGNADANQALSEARAQAVVEALVARGVPEAVLIAQGYGQSQPIADNNTEEGRAANRRTTIAWTPRIQ